MMTSSLNIIRLILHILASLLLTISIAFELSAIASTNWQTYSDPSSGEIHQHGLWYDYTLASRHQAGAVTPEWQWKYKFGQAVEGDEDHRWKPYQYNTLILLGSSAFLAFLSTIASYMAPYFISIAVIWVFLSIWPAFLSLAGIVVFFTTASLPMNNHVFVDRRYELEIGKSFYMALVATVGFGVSLAAVISAGILDILLLRRGERMSIRETYLRVSSKATPRRAEDTTSHLLEKSNQTTTV